MVGVLFAHLMKIFRSFTFISHYGIIADMVDTSINTQTTDSSKQSSTPESKGGTNKMLMAENNTYQVRSGLSPVGTPSFVNLLNQVTTIKLDRTNFLLWQSIVIPILKSYKLEGHLFGKTPAPEMSIILPPSDDEPRDPENDIWIAAD